MPTTPRPFGIDLTIWLMAVAAVAVAVELTYLRVRKVRVDYRDVAHSAAMAFSWAGMRMALGKALMFGTWVWLWREVAPWHPSVTDWRTWVAYVVLDDLVYYWTHRGEHRLRVLWSSHLIHHSSEQLNLATATRMPWTEVFYKPFLACWAPLLGFHPSMYVIYGVVSLMVGQWQHLAWFPRVKVLDAVFMTPSNHRVHHASNRRYLDKNFGGATVLWDKLFGTYQVEDEAPVYGVLHRPEADTTFKRSLGGFPELARDVRAAASLREALALAVGRPR